MTKEDKILIDLHRLPASTVRGIIRKWAACAVHMRTSIASSMEADGYDVVDADGPLTNDGREVVRIHDTAYALRPEVHAERLSTAFDAGRQRQAGAQPKEAETKSVVGTESLSSMVCPKCGDALQHTAVCPKCAAGRLGYRHRYTCVCGGVDLISKESL